MDSRGAWLRAPLRSFGRGPAATRLACARRLPARLSTGEAGGLSSVGHTSHTGAVTKRIAHTLYGFDRSDVVVKLLDDHEHPGKRRGELRAWALDDETGDWWGRVNTTSQPASNWATAQKWSTPIVRIIPRDAGSIGMCLSGRQRQSPTRGERILTCQHTNPTEAA